MPKKNSRRRVRGYDAPIPTICGGIPVTAIDVQVRNLVRVLNHLPGISTFSSCGGHRRRTHDCQAAAGHWYVNFDVDTADPGSWQSLELLAWLCTPQTGAELLPWTEEPGAGLHFEVRGDHYDAGLILEVNLSEWFRRHRGRV